MLGTISRLKHVSQSTKHSSDAPMECMLKSSMMESEYNFTSREPPSSTLVAVLNLSSLTRQVNKLPVIIQLSREPVS